MQINITYACNLNCGLCVQFLDIIPWENPRHIEIDDLILASQILRDHGIRVLHARISGGEPTMHPRYEECVEAIAKHWDYSYNKLIVCTNTVLEKPVEVKVRYRKSPPGWKEPRHTHRAVSPTDLGIPTPKSLPISCDQIRRCGRLFDAHGFGPCGNAGPLGRVLGVDPYSTTPIMHGYSVEMCKHCLAILGKEQQAAVWEDAAKGRIEYPSKTFREGFERELENPTVFKTFKERLAEEK